MRLKILKKKDTIINMDVNDGIREYLNKSLEAIANEESIYDSY
jgi:hypothetical protein